MKTTKAQRDSIRAQRSINKDAADLADDLDEALALLRDADALIRSLSGYRACPKFEADIAAAIEWRKET
jgi:hypothetical protein